MSRKQRIPPFVMIAVSGCAVLSLTAAASACPMCKDSVANTDGNVAAGFNNSIYFMLLGFFGCLGLVARTIIKGIRSSAVLPGFPVQGPKGSNPSADYTDHTDPTDPTDPSDSDSDDTETC